MRKLKLDVDELQVESFDTAQGSQRVATVRGHEDSTFVGDTECGTCPPGSFGGTCQVFGCGTGDCTQTCQTNWGCTCNETCYTCWTYNCGWGCTQQETCEWNCTNWLPECAM